MGTSWAKCVRKSCCAWPDLRCCGTDSQLLVRCDDLEKDFLKLPGVWSPSLLRVREFQGRPGALGPQKAQPGEWMEGSPFQTENHAPLSSEMLHVQREGMPKTLPGFWNSYPPFVILPWISWQSRETFGSIISLGLAYIKVKGNAKSLLVVSENKDLMFTHPCSQSSSISKHTGSATSDTSCPFSSLILSPPLCSLSASLLSPHSGSLVLSSFALSSFLSFEVCLFLCLSFPSMPVFPSLSYWGLVREPPASVFVGNFVLAVLLLSKAHLFAPVKEKKKKLFQPMSSVVSPGILVWIFAVRFFFPRMKYQRNNCLIVNKQNLALITPYPRALVQKLGRAKCMH